MSTHVYRRYAIDTGGSRKPKPPTSSASQYSQRLETIRNRINKKFTFTLFQLNDLSYRPDLVTLGRSTRNPGDQGMFRTRRTRSHPDVARYIARIAAINKAMSPPAPAPAPPRLKFDLNDIWAPEGTTVTLSSGGMISNAAAAPSLPAVGTTSTTAPTVAVSSVATNAGKTKRKRGDSDNTQDNGETAQVSEPRSMGADLTNTVGSNLSSKAAGKKKARVDRDQGKASKEQATFAPHSTASAPAPATTSITASKSIGVPAFVPSAPLTETALEVPAQPELTPEVYLGIDKSRPLDIMSTPISLSTSRVVVMADILEALSPFACESGNFTPTYVLPVAIPENYICNLEVWAAVDPNEPEDPVKTLYDRVFKSLSQPNQPYALENEFRIFKRLPSIFNKENIPHLPDAVADRLKEISETMLNWGEEYDEETMVLCIVQAIVWLSVGWDEVGLGESVIGCMRF